MEFNKNRVNYVIIQLLVFLALIQLLSFISELSKQFHLSIRHSVELNRDKIEQIPCFVLKYNCRIRKMISMPR